MKTISLILNLTIAVAPIGQAPPPSKPLSPSDMPHIQTLSRTVQSLRQSAKLTDVAEGTTDKLMEAANALIATVRQARCAESWGMLRR